MDTTNGDNANSGYTPIDLTPNVPPKPQIDFAELLSKVKIKYVIIFFAVLAVVMMIGLSFARMNKALKEMEATISPTPSKNKKEIVVEKPKRTEETPPVSGIQVPVADQKIIYVDGKNQLFEINPNGTGKKLLYVSASQILDMSASPNGEWLAFTTRDDKEALQSVSANFGYPITSLIVLDMKTQKAEQLDTPENSTIRYPRWSQDSNYLTFWQNDGQASRVYSLKDKKFVLEVTSDTQEETVSPIVFVPGTNNMAAYIYRNSLNELELTGKGKMTYLEGLEALRGVHEGPPLPNAPIYSPDGQLISLYKTDGDLIIFDKASNQSKALAEGDENGPFGVTPMGYAIGFNFRNELIYMATSETGYQADEVMPLFIYSKNATASATFSTQAKNLDIGSFLVSGARNRILGHSFYSGKGSMLFDGTGNMVRDCTETDFRYSYYSWGSGPDHASVAKVWSANEQSILSEPGDNLSVMNAYNCEVTKILDEKVTLSMWVNIRK